MNRVARVVVVAATAALASAGPASAAVNPTVVGPDRVFTMRAKISAIGTTDPAVSFQTTNCDDAGHLAAWMVQAQGSDDSWSFPISVDQTTGTETAFGPYKLVACFGPRGSGGNAENNKFIGLSLSLKGFAAPTKAGDYKWRVLWTPFADQSLQSGVAPSSALNQAGSVESQTTSRIQPGRLTLAAKKTALARATITGTLTVNGKPVSGATIAIQHGSRQAKLVSLGSAKTNAAGTLSKSVSVKRPAYFRAGATVAKQDLGAGGCAASFGVPCLDATIGGTAFVSNLLHVTGVG
jgi:hypothetical protein